MIESGEKSNSLPETFCPLPWIEVSSNPLGPKTSCTVAREFVENMPFGEFYNSPYMVNLRRDLAEGKKPANCRVCWELEAAGVNTLRKDQLRQFLDAEGEYGAYLMMDESRRNGFRIKGVEKLDFRLGTLCNLKCRMCMSANSSKIWAEYVENKEALDPFPALYLGVEDYYKEKREVATLEDLLSISYSLNRIGVSGGEPNLSLLLMDYLEKLVELGLSKNILLKINTNAVMNAPRLMKVYKEFRRVELLLSIDGTFELQEYIRHPSKWSQIENTVRELKEHFLDHDPARYRILAAPTYQALNILNLRDIVLWCEEIGIEWSLFHKIIDPDYLQVDVLPVGIRQIAAARLENFLAEHQFSEVGAQEIGFILHHLRNGLEFSAAKLDTFLKYNGTLDKIRRERFRQGCPELASLLGEFYEDSGLNLPPCLDEHPSPTTPLAMTQSQ